MGLCPDADIDPNFSMRQKDFAGSFRRIRTECPKNTSFTETLLRYASHVTVFYGTPGKLEKKKKSHFCQNTRENSRLPSWNFSLRGSNKRCTTDIALAAIFAFPSKEFCAVRLDQSDTRTNALVGWQPLACSPTFMNKRRMSKRSLDFSQLVRTATAILHSKLGWSKQRKSSLLWRWRNRFLHRLIFPLPVIVFILQLPGGWFGVF